MSARRYKLKKRAESQEQTRRRITEAVADLHRTVGPARTTITAIAERAGVQRLTVYRHFPTERELFAACSAHWLAGNPPPEPGAFAAIEAPAERTRAALVALYGWYRQEEAMLANVERDAPELPELAQVSDPSAHLDALRDVLLAGRRVRGARRRRTAAALGHALAFSTWRSLARTQELDDAEAARLMAALAEAA